MGDHDEYAYQAANEKFDGQISVPQTYEDAVNDPVYGPKWREAIKLELGNLIRFGTWKPKDHKVVSTKWGFLVKDNADGRFKHA